MLKQKVPSFFSERRKEILSQFPQSVFLLPSNPVFYRNPDVDYPYRQESNFHYLSGFPEAHSFMVLAQGKSILFVHPRDEMKEIWEGELYGVDRAQSVFSFDEVYSIEELGGRLPGYLKNAIEVYYALGRNAEADSLVTTALHIHRKSQGRSGEGVLPLLDINNVLGEMRLFKSKEEVEIIKKAAGASSKAHKKIMQDIQPGMNESEVRAMIEYYFKKNGCQDLGYGSIVAAGLNACCLHYRACNDTLKENELLLIDAGGEYEYYGADITRTFPISKKFTAEQKAVYERVLKANETVIEMVKPGLPYEALHAKANEVLAQGLIDLKLVQGSVSEIIENGTLKRYYPHGTGHYLGMDVHDVGLYKLKDSSIPQAQKGKHIELKKTSRPLEKGMLFTVEPGLYFQSYHTEIPEKFRGIGIRIEDNILVTDNGYENLTLSCPKKVKDLEDLRG